MQETWIDTIHTLTLRASDGLGDLKNVPLNDGTGAYLQGRFTPLQLIQYACGDAVNNFSDYYIISNLFHTSMTDATTDTGLDQCYVDARTFENSPTIFDDSYTVLEKINKSWNQTIFQYDGKWWIYRLEEIFQSETLELNGFRATPLEFPTRSEFQQRFDISVGMDEEVYPIAPEMIRFLKKPAKQTKIVFNWENFEEIVCNGTFTRGTLVSTSPTQVVYTVDCWTFQEGNPEGGGDGAIGDPIETGIGVFERRLDYVDGRLDDDYIVIEHDAGDVDKWIRSADIYCSQNDRLTISFQHKWGVNITASSVTTAYVLLYGDDSTYYTLQDDGTWSTSNASFTSGVTDLSVTFSSEGEEWMSFEVEADPIPKTGYLVVLLYRKDDVTGATTATKYFKDLKVEIIPQVQHSQFRQISGDFDRYTIERDITNTFEDEIFLDDADSKNHKGAIFESDGITLTGDQWYRRRLDTERFTFKRHNALAHWFINRGYKTKLDCNFFGLIWLQEGVEKPIGLINTIRFVDDAPTKVFGITNIKEIDFMSCQWSANLIEVYDSNIPDDVPGETDVHDFNYLYEN
jgi:hypothetical protein